MKTSNRITHKVLVMMLMVSMTVSQAHAWNPPHGPSNRVDIADSPPTATALLREAHGYITQNGISILDSDGYWFAAQMLQDWQQELLNGVRYADVYRGRQVAAVELCWLWSLKCDNVAEQSWVLAGDNHYFNPDTGLGFNPGKLNEAAFWTQFVPQGLQYLLTGGLVYVDFDIKPDLEDGYPSALQMFKQEYPNALNAYLHGSAPSIGGRQGTALAMFYLGWASHLVQDQTVVNHTFDEPFKHHAEYENAADGLVNSRPIANGQQRGIYANQLPILASQLRVPPIECNPGSRTCFASYAAYVSHDANVLARVDNQDYSSVNTAIPFAQNLQAGLYAAFLTDIGLPPVQMSAIVPAL